MFFIKSPFGLDISDYSIEVLQLNKRKKPVAFGRLLLEAGIVKDGIILDSEKLIEKVKEVISAARTKTSQVILALPESKVFSHIINLPKNLKDEELKNAIISEATKALPLEQKDIHWDYQVISYSDEKNQQNILYIGTLKKIIDDYINVLSNSGLEPVAFEIESLALSRALLKKPKTKNSILIVDIGARTTNINIFDNYSNLKLTSAVPVAGYHFTKAISEFLNISLKEAEKIKRKYGFGEEKKEIRSVLEKEISPIINEIKKISRYYDQGLEQSQKPMEILLVGGSALLPKITDFLSLNLGLKVNLGFSDITKQLKDKSILYNTVIGLALRGIKRHPATSGINLLPLKNRPKSSFVDKKIRENKYFKYIGFCFGVVGLAILGWIVYAKIIKNFPSSSSFEVIPSGVSTQIKEATEKETAVGELVKEEIKKEETESAATTTAKIGQIKIIQTETGWLNVRSQPSTNADIITKVYPQESYPLLEKNQNWFKIELKDKKVGWISSKYATTTK